MKGKKTYIEVLGITLVHDEALDVAKALDAWLDTTEDYSGDSFLKTIEGQGYFSPFILK